MSIIEVTCFNEACKKGYLIDSVYRDRYMWCNGHCYRKSLDKLPKYKENSK